MYSLTRTFALLQVVMFVVLVLHHSAHREDMMVATKIFLHLIFSLMAMEVGNTIWFSHLSPSVCLPLMFISSRTLEVLFIGLQTTAAFPTLSVMHLLHKLLITSFLLWSCLHPSSDIPRRNDVWGTQYKHDWMLCPRSHPPLLCHGSVHMDGTAGEWVLYCSLNPVESRCHTVCMLANQGFFFTVGAFRTALT